MPVIKKRKTEQKSEKRAQIQRTDYRSYRLSRKETALFLLEGAALTLLADRLFYQSLFALPFLGPLVVFWVLYMRREKCRERLERLEEHFGQSLSSISVSLRAGLAVEHAFYEAERELRELFGPEDEIVTEFAGMNRQIRNRVPPEKLLIDFADRTDLEEIRSFAEVFAAARRSGGNMAEIVRAASESIGNKILMEREIRMILAAKKSEFRIMCMMPAGVILYMQLASPGFLDVLYGNAFGAVFMTVCLAVYLAAIVIGQRMIRIEV